MEHMTFDVNQDVLIVSVLDLEDIADQTVSAEWVREVFHSLLVLLWAWFTVLAAEVIENRCVTACFLLNWRDWKSIWDHLYKSTVRSCRDNLIRFKPEGQLCFLEDLIALADQLHCECLLSEVIVSFHNHSEKPPRLKRWKWWVCLHSFLLFFRRFQEYLVVVAIIKEVNIACLIWIDSAQTTRGLYSWLILYQQLWFFVRKRASLLLLNFLLGRYKGQVLSLTHSWSIWPISFFFAICDHVLFHFTFFLWDWDRPTARSPHRLSGTAFEGGPVSLVCLFI